MGIIQLKLKQVIYTERDASYFSLSARGFMANSHEMRKAE
jgi:hypothetical protein